MPKILHLLEHLTNDSISNAILSVADWSTRLHGHEHTFAVMGPADDEAIARATEAGIELILQPELKILDLHIESADIVQVEYFNAPAVNDLMRQDLPEMRLALWNHTPGVFMPGMLSRALASMTDVCISSTFATQNLHPTFVDRRSDEPAQRLAHVLHPTDFSQLAGFTNKPHTGFNVGYINNMAPEYMHPELVAMNTAVEVSHAAFYIYAADAKQLIQEVSQLPSVDRFEISEVLPNMAAMMQHLDVFGYALNPQTIPSDIPYLQAAMWAGLPVVAMTHESVNNLIRHNETGLIARTPEDFSRSLEFLYNNPVERKRIALNASIFARTHLGAQNAAHEFKKIYEFLLTLPKRSHTWGASPYRQHTMEMPASPPEAARQFVEAMDGEALAFEISLDHPELEQQLSAEKAIGDVSRPVFDIIQRYTSFAETDPHLHLWAGLYLEKNTEYATENPRAITEFAAAIEHGLSHWRVEWYLARALYKAGKIEESKRIYNNLRESVPDFNTITGDSRFDNVQHTTFEFTLPAPELPVQETLTIEEPEPMETEEMPADDMQLMDTPEIKVSAIVSTYASEEFIDGCLHDLVSQSLFQKGELEIIIVDANSPEKEQEVVERYQANFDNIHYIRTPEREPLYASWNRGIKMANGDYITSANTDDRHRKDALELMAKYLDAHPEFALLYAGQIDTSVPNESFETTSSMKILNWPPYSYQELERHCIIGSQPMWRKSMHDQYGYFREDLKSAGDYEFWLRIGKHETFYRYPETLGLYYRNPEGIEHSSQTSEQETLQIWQEYGMFERGVPVILNGRIITRAKTPTFTAPVNTASKVRPPFDVYVSKFEGALYKNELDQALSVAESACLDYPELPYPMVLKAIVLRQQLKYNEALDALGESIDCDETPEALVELVQLSLATGQEDEARRTTAYIEEKYPEWKDRLSAIKNILLEDTTASASGPAQLDDLDYSLIPFDELKDQFEQILRASDIDRAEALASAAIRNFPDNHEAWVLKATSERLNGNFHEAREAIHKSLLIEDSPEALIELYQVSEALGDREEAENIASMFGVAYPDHTETFSALFPDAV